MKRRALYFVIPVLVVLASCGSRLPRSLRNDVHAEQGKLQQASQDIQRAESSVKADLAQAPDLFQAAAVSQTWTARLRTDREKLATAQSYQREIDSLVRRDRTPDRDRIVWLLNGQRNLRQAAQQDAAAVAATADHWVAFRHDLPSSLARMNSEYDAVHKADLTPVATVVAKAESDWPSKKTDLDTRLAALRAIPADADTKWRDTQTARQDAAAGKASAAQIATLIQTDELLSQDAAKLPKQSQELQALSGQLYNGWDKILADLDVTHEGPQRVYREKLNVITTHFVDVAAKKTEVTHDEHWVEVPEPAFRSVENDLGMAIAHKDAGQYDAEAQTTPQPAGFAYIAPPSQGSNQYGYWSHAGGTSVWTWLPQYLIMRELLWGHGGYRPILPGEYNGYRTAERAGHTYYGQETPTAPPKYGSHGTFTQQRYASSRYVQSGGFRSSGYASRGATAPSPSRWNAWRSESRSGDALRGNGAGRRFGRGSSSPSIGRRFGGGGSRGFGRSFGRRR